MNTCNFFYWITRIKIVVLISVLLTGCIPYQAYIYMIPDQKDIKRFKHEVVKHDEACYYFKKRPTNKQIQVSNWVYSTPVQSLSLDKFLIDREALNFLVIKNDSIVYEFKNKKQNRTNLHHLFLFLKYLFLLV